MEFFHEICSLKKIQTNFWAFKQWLEGDFKNDQKSVLDVKECFGQVKWVRAGITNFKKRWAGLTLFLWIVNFEPQSEKSCGNSTRTTQRQNVTLPTSYSSPLH